MVARAMLDEKYGTPIDQHLQDGNGDLLGSMCENNVTIARLPSGMPGAASAARVATHLWFTFSSNRIGLLLGIGGGVPSS